MNGRTRIIGIDPGLRNMGWGVIDVAGPRLGFVAAGTVRADTDLPLAERLRTLHEKLTDVVSRHHPDEASVEQTFVNKDAAATLKLGQARGIAMLVPAQADMPVAEYAPNAVKKAVVGAGHADKKQVQLMVSMLLPKATWDSDDAADALAIAICHAHNRGRGTGAGGWGARVEAALARA